MGDVASNLNLEQTTTVSTVRTDVDPENTAITKKMLFAKPTKRFYRDP